MMTSVRGRARQLLSSRPAKPGQQCKRTARYRRFCGGSRVLSVNRYRHGEDTLADQEDDGRRASVEYRLPDWRADRKAASIGEVFCGGPSCRRSWRRSAATLAAYAKQKPAATARGAAVATRRNLHSLLGRLLGRRESRMASGSARSRTTIAHQSWLALLQGAAS